MFSGHVLIDIRPNSHHCCLIQCTSCCSGVPRVSSARGPMLASAPLPPGPGKQIDKPKEKPQKRKKHAPPAPCPPPPPSARHCTAGCMLLRGSASLYVGPPQKFYIYTTPPPQKKKNLNRPILSAPSTLYLYGQNIGL